MRVVSDWPDEAGALEAREEVAAAWAHPRVRAEVAAERPKKKPGR